MKTCPECAKICADNALFCPSCGYTYINVPPKSTTSRMPRSRMRRLPNGFGSVKKLTGKRRNPYAAYPPTKGYHDNGTAIYRQAIGYYPTYNDAYTALLEYNKSPYDLAKRQATFTEVYDLFIKEKVQGLSKQSKASYNAAYKNSKAIHDRVYSMLRKEDYQQVIDSCPLKHSSKELIVNLFKQMGKYAMAHDIIAKDYAQFVSVGVPDDDEKGVPFTIDEIKQVVANNDRVAIILLYTGMRISELKTITREGDFLRGGLKTKAGKNRLIPIHHVIKDMDFDFSSFNAYKYRTEFKERYNHTPHDLRHTTTWLLQTHGADDLCTRLILGHSLGGDIEKNTYGHRTPEQLTEAIEKIPDFCLLIVS